MRIGYKERKKIEEMYREGFSVIDIAKELGVCRATIYYELRKGTTIMNGLKIYDANLANLNSRQKIT